jgi:hypothetical protein
VGTMVDTPRPTGIKPSVDILNRKKKTAVNSPVEIRILLGLLFSTKSIYIIHLKKRVAIIIIKVYPKTINSPGL